MSALVTIRKEDHIIVVVFDQKLPHHVAVFDKIESACVTHPWEKCKYANKPMMQRKHVKEVTGGGVTTRYVIWDRKEA